MVDWQNHVPRTVGLGFGVGFLLFVIHISLWLIDQVGNQTAQNKCAQYPSRNLTPISKILSWRFSENDLLRSVDL